MDTAVLLNRSDLKPIAYGVAAKLAYLSRRENSRYFEGFKIHLANLESSDHALVVADSQGVECDLIDVLTATFKCISDEVVSYFRVGTSTPDDSDDSENSNDDDAQGITKNSLFWVITVPVLWTPAANMLMLRACIRAGLVDSDVSQNIRFINEAEAAAHSVVNTEEFLGSFQLEVGFRFSVLDMGGGTSDYSSLEICSIVPLKVRELVRCDGELVGGTNVDQQFLEMISSIIGDAFRVMKRTTAFVDLMTNFEDAKASEDKEKKVLGFADLFSEFSEMNNDNPYSTFPQDVDRFVRENPFYAGMTCTKTSLSIPFVVWEKWFDNVLERIFSLIDRNLQLTEIEFLYLVGGLSESVYIVDKIKKHVQSKGVRVIKHPKPDVANVLGGVLAQRYENVHGRRAMVNYGTCVYERYDENIHAQEKIQVIDNGRRVKVFQKLVEQGQSLPNGYLTPPQTYRPTDSSAKTIAFELLSIDATLSPDEVVYRDDERIQVHTKVHVDVQLSQPYDSRVVKMQLQFNGVPKMIITNEQDDLMGVQAGVILTARGTPRR
eukprot:c9876_g1_i1.p1 GENE.c9876_g1_i1~~c9876_g1_i1.p1  ORF type:complete len:597 (-),score=110.98 c9876_g1_i1:79-1725(-)